MRQIMQKSNNAVIRNLEKVITGDIASPIRDADSILVVAGKIQEIGNNLKAPEKTFRDVDARGMIAIPGLFECHAHNAVDEYAPITKTVDWMANLGRSGITTMITEGEHGPGYPRYYDDPIGVKAEAIFINRVFRNWRPGNCIKVHGGGIILVHGLVEADFKEMAAGGVRLVAEIGGGGLYHPDDVAEMCDWAHKYGMLVSVHCGPPSIPGSAYVKAEDFLRLRPEKAAHINGGSTSLPWEQLQDIIDNTESSLEVVFHSNLKVGLKVVERCRERGELHRVIFGSDQAIGLALTPGSIWGLITQISSLGDLPPEQVICMATGNSARTYEKALEIKTGFLKEGYDADIVITDTPPGPEEAVGKNVLDGMRRGLFCAPAMTMLDGKIMAIIGQDYQPTKRHVKIDGVEQNIDDVVEYLFGIPHPGY